MTDTTELEAQIASLQGQVNELTREKRDSLTRIQDEEALRGSSYDIIKLTKSDDLEAVKRTVNQIIDELSKN